MAALDIDGEALAEQADLFPGAPLSPLAFGIVAIAAEQLPARLC